MNVVRTGAGQVHRGAGNGRGRGVQPQRARRAARPRRARHRPDLRAAARDDRGPAGAPPAVTLRLVVATANPDKAREIRAVLDARRARRSSSSPRPDDVPRSRRPATTLVENARLKAVALRDATGLAALGEDTGLEVDALGGAPGVYSARYAGEDATYADNVTKLLHDMDAVRRASRTARFRTAVVLALARRLRAVGRRRGRGRDHAEAPAATRGFGYDPVFAPAGAGGRTFAELDAERKHAISHRGRALRALAARLREAGRTTVGGTAMPLDPQAKTHHRPHRQHGRVRADARDTEPEQLRAALRDDGGARDASRSPGSRTGRSPGPAGDIPVRIYDPRRRRTRARRSSTTTAAGG